jgi:hypothetical protein
MQINLDSSFFKKYLKYQLLLCQLINITESALINAQHLRSNWQERASGMFLFRSQGDNKTGMFMNINIEFKARAASKMIL